MTAVKSNPVKLLLAVMLASLSAQSNVFAEGTGPNEWLVKIQTDERPDCLKYNGSNMAGMARVSVTYSAKSQGNKPLPYERIWYHDGQPVGLERQGALKLTPTEGVVLEVTGQAEGQGDSAAAGAILRLVLDVQSNFNSLLGISVPANRFDSIVTELKKMRCSESDPSRPVEVERIPLPVHSVPPGKYRRLYYH